MWKKKNKDNTICDLSVYEEGEFKLSKIQHQCNFSRLEEKILLKK